MARRAVSVTLEIDNVIWLKGRAGAAGESVSELLDQIVTAARLFGHSGEARSVVGTIDIDSSDPLLQRADASVRAAFEASLGRPVVARDVNATHRSQPRSRRPPKRRG